MLKNYERAATSQSKVAEISAMDSLEFAARFLRRQLWVVLFMILLLGALGAVYAVVMPPTYMAKASLVTDSKRLQLTQSFGEATIDPLELETQVEILKSENVLLPVVRKLRLTERPGFRASPGLLSKLFGSSESNSEFALEQRALQALLDSFGATRIARTRIIEISFKARDPNFAAEVVNGVADSFILEQLEARSQGARQASAWLEGRIRDLGEEASRAEQAVVKFKRENNIVDAGGRLTAEQQLAETNTKLGNARAETAEARAKLSRIEATLARNRGDANVNATVADSLKNQVVMNLREQYFTLANREAEYSARYGKDHMAVIKLRNQMREVRNSILDELQRLSEVYKSDLEIAEHKEEQLEKEYALAVANSQAASQSQIKLRELEGSARTNRALYDSFLARNIEQVQQQSMRIGDARLISPASPPLKPSNKKFLPIVIGVLGGAVLGLGIAVLREKLDRGFRTGQQVEKLLRTKCLALVPRLETKGANRSADAEKDAALCKGEGYAPSDKNAIEAKGVRKVISKRRGPETAIVDAPFSRFADEFHSIKLAADLSGSMGSSKVIGVTSSLPGEGKSTIAVNLARLIARTGARTVLVDCDFRRPELSNILAPEAGIGMREVIAGTASVAETMWEDELTELVFLPAGAKSRVAHPNEILASEAAPKLFENLRQVYNWVVVDLPPIGPITDVQLTTRFIDSYLLVIEWGQTDSATVQHALDRAKEVDDCFLGAILNKVEMDELSRYCGNHINKINKYYSENGRVVRSNGRVLSGVNARTGLTSCVRSVSRLWSFMSRGWSTRIGKDLT
jgi:polysaccharide biosynthesis transport protein